MFFLILLGICTIVGTIGVIAGFGGGWITTPLMILGFTIPPPIATATAIFMIIITSTVGGLAHILYGHVTVLFIPLTLGLLIGTEIGARIRTRIQSEHISLVIIVSLFIISIVKMASIFIPS